jgi:hypothetical protein
MRIVVVAAGSGPRGQAQYPRAAAVSRTPSTTDASVPRVASRALR